uniref:Unannotated protein n=1 Tax=freshwater metagenome TaxID=449393 RepID=A0A6J7Q2U8_9ZZZZ
MSLVAPSPSRAICLVSERATSKKAASKTSCPTGPAAPLASTIAVSLVEVSVSTDTELKVLSTTLRNIASSASGAISASVKIRAIIVAMFGSIMPTPLATPTTRH